MGNSSADGGKPKIESNDRLANLAAWLKRIRSHAFWVAITSPRSLWHGAVASAGWIYGLSTKLPWIVAVLVIGAIVYDGLTQHATVINPISVPKDLADRGYTPDVAGHRLRDAMVHYMNRVDTRKEYPEIAMHGDLPNIVVPTVGISLDAVVSSIRTILRSTRSRAISGEIVEREKLLWLSLRLDGQEFYTSKTGADPNKPDDVFDNAAGDVLTKISPYHVAITWWPKDQQRAIKIVGDNIEDANVPQDQRAWFYNLRGIYFLTKREYPPAILALQKAIRLDGASAYRDTNRREAAIAEFKEALRLDPKLEQAQRELNAMNPPEATGAVQPAK